MKVTDEKSRIRIRILKSEVPVGKVVTIPVQVVTVRYGTCLLVLLQLLTCVVADHSEVLDP